MNDEEVLSKKALFIVLVITLGISLVGMILLVLGLNNWFFIDNEIIFAIFFAISQLGWHVGLVVLVAIVFCTYDMRVGKNLLISLIGSYFLNSILKDIIQDPTPPTRVEKPGFGFPSGHAQNSVATYGFLAHHAYKKGSTFIPWILFVIIYLITISRVIIGSHDVDDVIGGLLFGIAFLIAFIYLEPILTEKMKALSFSVKIILAIILPTLLFVAAVLIFPSTDNEYGTIGAIIGASIGYLIEKDKINYNPHELNKKQKVINLIIGLVIILGLYLLLNYAVPLDHPIWEFSIYTIISLIGFLLLPWIFVKIQRK